MKYWLCTLFIFSTLWAFTHSLPEIRQLYKQSAAEETSCKQLVANLKGYTEYNNPLMAGYKACGTMMMANYVWNPLEKLSNFNEGKNLLEKCIKRDPANIELRFLRFSVQNNAPAFLNYNQSLESDKKILVNKVISLHDKQLRKFIMDYLLQSTQLTVSEKQTLLQ
jgi:hypothetical protein